jgi:hypothetical protein
MYSVVGDAQALAAAADLIEINAPSTAIVVLHEVHITQDTIETSEQMAFQIHRASTSGSGGSAQTAVLLEEGSTAFGGTCEKSNTSRGTEGDILYRISENILNGVHIIFPPECRPVVSPSGRIVIGLESTPGASTTFSTTVIFEEIGT